MKKNKKFVKFLEKTLAVMFFVIIELALVNMFITQTVIECYGA